MTVHAEVNIGPTETLTHEREDFSRHVGGAALAGVVLLAIALRLYRLGEQSLWLDDFVTFRHLGVPDLQSCLRLLRVEVPEYGTAPLYFVLQYCFGKCAGTHAETARLLPVAITVSAVPLLYGFVHCLLGKRKAALFAALCLALSPQHIWYAQELRPYELATPLAIISAWTFIRGYRGDRALWWAVNLVTNTLLVWTHPVTVFLILAEGLFLLAFSLRRFRRLVVWSAVQWLLLLPSLVVIFRMAFSNHYITGGSSAWDVFNNMLGSDVVRYHTEILPAWKTHETGAAFATFPQLIPLCPWFDWALLGVFTGAFAWAVVRPVPSLCRWRRAANLTQGSRCEFENVAFLLLMLLVPVLSWALMATLTKSYMVCPHYTMYSQMALYGIVGAALAALPGAPLRRGAVLVLLGLYGFQWRVFLPEVTRTNWKAAAAYIKNNASQEDVVIDIQHFYPDGELAFYLAQNWPVRVVGTLQAACDDSARFLQAVPSTPPPDNVRKHVWIALQPGCLGWVTRPPFDCAGALAQALDERGLKYSFREFPGQFDVLVCSVERGGGAVCGIGLPVWQIKPPPYMFGGALLRPIDYDAVLDELGFRGCDQGVRRRLLAELRESVDHWPLDEKFIASSRLGCVWPVLDLVGRGHCALAEALAGYLIGRHPDFGLLHMALGAAFLKEGRIPAAQGAFVVAGKLHRDLGVVLAPFMDALARGDNSDAMCDAAGKLKRDGFWFAFTLVDACRADGPAKGFISTLPEGRLHESVNNKGDG